VNLGSQEQARGIEQISKAIAQMDQVTQGTAASAEEGASASQQLSAQAEAMGHAVRKLSRMVGDTSETHVRPPVAVRAPVISKSKPIPMSPRASASPGLRALRPPVSKPAPLQHVGLAESPTDAQFLESFEEM
jgi:methyl-accepting chemotaxis protein/methyl-accepting chemotaxis protein-1 (serine sensor receptor)